MLWHEGGGGDVFRQLLCLLFLETHPLSYQIMIKKCSQYWVILLWHLCCELYNGITSLLHVSNFLLSVFGLTQAAYGLKPESLAFVNRHNHRLENIRESFKLKPRKSSQVSSRIWSIEKVHRQTVFLILIHDVSVVHICHALENLNQDQFCYSCSK